MALRRSGLAQVVVRETRPGSGAQNPLRDRRRHLPLWLEPQMEHWFRLFREVGIAAINPTERVDAAVGIQRERLRRQTAAAHATERPDALLAGDDLASIRSRDNNGAWRRDEWRRGRVGSKEWVDMRFAAGWLLREGCSLGLSHTIRGRAVAAASVVRFARWLQAERHAGARASAGSWARRNRLQKPWSGR